MLNKNQQLAVDKQNSNLLVSASAGSGKTHVLITRIVKLILEEKTDVSKLLVVTFTNASAEELKQRLTNKLSEELNNISSQEIRQRLLNQIEEIPLSDISTIHSFCVKLVRRYFYELNLDPAFKLVIDGLSDLKLKAINNVLDRYMNSSDAEFEKLYFALNDNRSKTKLINLVLSVCSKLEKTADKQDVLNCFSDNLNTNSATIYANSFIKNTANILINKIKLFISQIPYSNDTFVQNYSLLLNHLLNLAKTDDFITNFVNIINFKPKSNGKTLNENKEDYAFILDLYKKEFLDKFKDLFNGYKEISQIQNNITNSSWLTKKLFEIADEYQKEFYLLKQEKAILDLTDIVSLTVKLLKNEKIKNEIQNCYDYIFIDEYQDTDSVQEFILTSIAKHNNMFMVGDIKQSIYGFRLCDPTIFSNKYALFEFVSSASEQKDNVKINLNLNYRSNVDILNFVNKVCSKCLTTNLGKINYKLDAMLETEVNVNAIKNIPSVQIFAINKIEKEKNVVNLEDIKPYSVKNASVNVDEDNLILETEAKIIASQILSIVGSELEIEENNKIVTRKIKYSDICILSRTRINYFDKLASKLLQYEIPVNIAVKNDIYSTIEVKMLVDMLNIISNFNNDICLSSVMLNFYNFSYQDLVEIRKNYTLDNFYNAVLNFSESINGEIYSKIQTMLNGITNFRLISSYITVYELLEKIIESCDYLLLINSMENSNEKLFNLNLFLNSIKNSNLTINEFISSLSNPINTNLKEFNIDSGEDSVTLQTIHNSKGLEYPVVILCNTGKDITRSQSTQNEISFNKDIGLSFASVDIENRTKDKSVIENIIKFKNKRESFEEYLRLLYVALTRAKNNLIVVGEVNFDKLNVISDEIDVLHSKTFMQLILNSFNKTEINKIMHNAITYFDSNVVVHNVKSEDVNFNTTSKKFNNVFYNLNNFEDEKVIENTFNFNYKNLESTKLSVKNTVSQLNIKDDEFVSYNYAPKKLVLEENNILPPDKKGTLYHLVMQNINFNISSLKEVETELKNMLSKNIITQLELENINQTQILNCVLCLKNYLKPNSVIYKEQPFVMLENYNNIVASNATDEVLVQGIIDLIIQNEDATYVIDYKTTLGSEKHLLDLYSTQLNLYGLSVSHALEKDNVIKLIYSFELNKFIEIK